MFGTLVLIGDRPDIVFAHGELYGGLHCGDCFQCYNHGKWLDVRLEYQDDWVFIWNRQILPIPYGAKVRK